MSQPYTRAASQPVRFWAAFAVLPLLDALLGYVGFPLVWYIGGHAGRPADPDDAAGALALVSGLLGVIVTFGGAVPAVLWLMKRGPVSLRQIIVLGVILGNAPFVLLVAFLVLPLTVTHLLNGTMSQHLLPLSELIAGTLRALAVGSTLGLCSAVVFWLLALRRSEHVPDLGLR